MEGSLIRSDSSDWYVLLIGGPSGIGKTVIAQQLGLRLGIPWLMVDDLRLAMVSSGLTVPDSEQVTSFAEPNGLITVGELMSPAIEAIIANHVDTRSPIIVEGDGILPSLFDRPLVGDKAADGHVRPIFLFALDETTIHTNMRARERGLEGWTDIEVQEHVRKNYQFGMWLRREAEHRDLPTIAVRSWTDLHERIIAKLSLGIP